MRSDELRAAVLLATRTVNDAVSHVEQMHRSIAGKAFRFTTPIGGPARFVHNAVTRGAYGAVRGISVTIGLIAGDVAGGVTRSDRPAGSTPASNLAIAVLNATLGDELAAQDSPLAISMALRVNRTDVPATRDALVGAFPKATPKMAVFLHGLGETEESWRLHAHRHGPGTEATYGSRLAEDFGYTPVYVRYNSGLHISENGRSLSTLLDEVCAAWPSPVQEILLVGHSMGGLVARSACHQAEEHSDVWVNNVRHIFYLGTPHLGARMEQWVSRLSDLVGKLDEGRVLASVLDRRSAGIKDLHAGALFSDERCSADAVTQRRAMPLLPQANHYAISATITRSRRNPLGAVVGDLLVHPASARGGDQVPFRVEHKRHFGGLHHFDLLNDPEVYEAMREWLSQPVPAEVRSTTTEPLSDDPPPRRDLGT